MAALETSTFSTDRIGPRAWARLLATPTADIFVARDALDLLGAAVVLHHARRRHARLYSLAVAEKARGQGIASALLDAAEANAEKRGAVGVRLEVRSGDAKTRKLYESRGYARLSEVPDYYEDGAAATRYELRLS